LWFDGRCFYSAEAATTSAPSSSNRRTDGRGSALTRNEIPVMLFLAGYRIFISTCGDVLPLVARRTAPALCVNASSQCFHQMMTLAAHALLTSTSDRIFSSALLQRIFVVGPRISRAQGVRTCFRRCVRQAPNVSFELFVRDFVDSSTLPIRPAAIIRRTCDDSSCLFRVVSIPGGNCNL